MKKLGYVLAILLFCMVTPVEAGMVLHEEGDLKVSIEEASAVMLYDFKTREVLTGMKSSVATYKDLKLDIGIIGEYDNADQVDIFVGISSDSRVFEYKENIYGSIGVFASPGWIDEGPVRYGFYGSISVKF